MKKRLAILIYSLAPGGAERVVSVLLPELVRDYRVTLVLMNETRFYPVPEEVEIHWLEHSDPAEVGWKKFLKLPLLAWRYRNFCRQNGIGLSLSFMTRPNYINVLAKSMGSGAKTLISERAMPSLQYGYPGIASRLNRWLIRRLYPRADCLLPNSFGNREDLIRNFGIPADKCRVLYNPFDLEKIRQKAEKPPKGWKEGGFVFLTVGRLDRGKNQKLLIEALAGMGHGGARLVIIGEGPLEGELRRRARELGVEERVELVGRQSNPFAWMRRADCFVFASNHEGFPNVLVEALACGTPVISTDCLSGPREILEGRTSYTDRAEGIRITECGLLVPVGAVEAMSRAMEKVYNDADLCRELAGKSLRCVERFEKRGIVRELTGILEKCQDTNV